MYVRRTIEETIEKANAFFPVVMITGARQVGKTTVFQNCEKTPRRYVSLDGLSDRELAQNEPELFLKRYPAPVLIDEVQYAPQLFPYIKKIVDGEKKAGLYWLTGSQQFDLMKNVSESLAGRVGILRLQGFSQCEKQNHPEQEPFLPTPDFIEKQARTAVALKYDALWKMIWKGSYPKMNTADDGYWEMFYESYLQTYIERDIRQLTAVSNEMDFIKFMRSAAARTGQLLNYAEIANDVGVSQPTVKSWLSVLQMSGLVCLLYPYSNNITKRMIKTPKLYFTDTGLAAYLTAWKTPETLEAGAMNGAFLETYVVSEILKSYWHNGTNPNVFFYRDRDMKEIDLVLEENGKLYPVEIKKKSNPDKADVKNFDVLKNTGREIGSGAVVCLCETHLPITENVSMLPIEYL